MKRYYITDRLSCPVDVLDCVEANASRGVDWVQIREKDLAARDLVALTRQAVARVAPYGSRVLVNGRLDVALAAAAHGAHLPSHAPAPSDLRPAAPAGFLIAVSTHTLDEVRRAEREGADFVVFGPVYPTSSKPGLEDIPGLEGLRAACRAVDMPVAALGGIAPGRVASCADAGASAVAGISMFQGTGALHPPCGQQPCEEA
jgi:thiamine-phosphate pyrophosphorylase